MSSSEQRNGALLGLAAYLLWGVFPIYFKMVAEVPPWEVLAHRIVWSFALLVPLVAWRREWPAIHKALTTPRTLGLLVCSTFFILCNWFTFIYAISVGQVLQSSLGYFINPLVSVLCGALFLGERLSNFQRLSIALAAAGVVIQTWLLGELPLISLILAFSFGLYGLLRKILRIEPFVGLLIEVALVTPVALGYLIMLHDDTKATFLAGPASMDFTLAMSGVVTASPLLLFGAAMKKLRLTTMGILQYIVPTCHFLLAVFLYGEQFSSAHMVSFLCIWTGLAIFSTDTFRGARVKAG
jgi:chloramphenicol-sensitive protein RarD